MKTISLLLVGFALVTSLISTLKCQYSSLTRWHFFWRAIASACLGGFLIVSPPLEGATGFWMLSISGVLAGAAVLGFPMMRTLDQATRDALKRDEELRELQRIARVSRWELDIPSGKFTLSEEKYRLIGQDPKTFDPTIESYLALLEESERDRAEQCLQATLEEDAEFAFSYRLVRPDGEVRYLRCNGDLQRDAEGNPLKLVGTSQDLTDLETTQAALKQSRQLYVSLVEDLPLNVFRKDLEGRFTYVNQALCDFLNLPAEDIIGKLDLHVSPAEMVEKYREDDDYVVRTKKPFQTIESNMKHGIKRTVRVWKTPVLDSEGNVEGIQGIFWDVTNQIEAEEELRQSEERFRLLAENVPGVIYLCRSDDENNLVYLNDSIQQLSGYCKEEFLAGKVSFSSLCHPEDLEKIQKEKRDALENHVPFQLTYRVKHRDGDWKWIQEYGAGVYNLSKLGMVEGFLCDITEQMQAIEQETATQKRIARQQSAIIKLSTSPQLVQGNILTSAREICEMSASILGVDRVAIWLFSENRESLSCLTRYTRADRQHKSPDSTLTVQQYPRYFAAIKSGRAVDAVHVKTDPRTSEDKSLITNTQTEGSDLDLLAVESILDAAVRMDGQVAGVICHESVGTVREWTRDEVNFAAELADQFSQVMVNGRRWIAESETRQVQAQLLAQQQQETDRVAAELQRVRDDLIHSTRLATVGQMSAQMAHDLRNPLGAMLNSVNYLKRIMPPELTSAKDPLQLIVDEIELCKGIINNLLEVTHGKPPQRESINLEELVQETARSLGIPHSVDVQFQAEPEQFFLHADPTQFRQVFNNLMKNALDAVEGQGKITIHAHRDRRSQTITIEDSGPGIPEELHETIFDLFFTTKARGTGLGLGICRQILERHGGTIQIDSTCETGTRFCLLIPFSQSNNDHSSEDSDSRTHSKT